VTRAIILLVALLALAPAMSKLGIAALADVSTEYWADSVFDGSVKKCVTDSTGKVIGDTVVPVYAKRWVVSVVIPIMLDGQPHHMRFIVPMDMNVDTTTFIVRQKP